MATLSVHMVNRSYWWLQPEFWNVTGVWYRVDGRLPAKKRQRIPANLSSGCWENSDRRSMQPVAESTWTAQWRAVLCRQRDITHLLGADGRGENRSGGAMYVYPIFSVQVTGGAVICTENVSLVHLSYAGGRVMEYDIMWMDVLWTVLMRHHSSTASSVFLWQWGITFLYICVPWVGNLCRSLHLHFALLEVASPWHLR